MRKAEPDPKRRLFLVIKAIYFTVQTTVIILFLADPIEQLLSVSPIPISNWLLGLLGTIIFSVFYIMPVKKGIFFMKLRRLWFFLFQFSLSWFFADWVDWAAATLDLIKLGLSSL